MVMDFKMEAFEAREFRWALFCLRTGVALVVGIFNRFDEACWLHCSSWLCPSLHLGLTDFGIEPLREVQAQETRMRRLMPRKEKQRRV